MEFADWEEKDAKFNLEQVKIASEIRMKEGRARPIDVLSHNLDATEDFDADVSFNFLSIFSSFMYNFLFFRVSN